VYTKEKRARLNDENRHSDSLNPGKKEKKRGGGGEARHSAKGPEKKKNLQTPTLTGRGKKKRRERGSPNRKGEEKKSKN